MSELIERLGIDEDEMVEVTSFGGPVRFLPVGIQRAQAAVRGLYLDGRITIEVFEAETDRLLRKEAGIA